MDIGLDFGQKRPFSWRTQNVSAVQIVSADVGRIRSSNFCVFFVLLLYTIPYCYSVTNIIKKRVKNVVGEENDVRGVKKDVLTFSPKNYFWKIWI